MSITPCHAVSWEEANVCSAAHGGFSTQISVMMLPFTATHHLAQQPTEQLFLALLCCRPVVERVRSRIELQVRVGFAHAA
jgi:hypothetical protein